MPRGLVEYSPLDWLRLRPLSHAWKTLASNAINRRFLRLPPPDAEANATVSRQISGHNIITTIAWNTPWVLRWHIKFVQANLRAAKLIVADNSSDPDARMAIRQLCADNGIPYFALPQNPYGPVRYASRSHGLALNWTYQNVIRPANPGFFGFLDHDLMPTGPLDPAQLLGNQPFFGRLVMRGNRWYLWPGYCFFRSKSLDGRDLDFRQDWFAGLDTGGMNWTRLYRDLDRQALTFSRVRNETLGLPSADDDEFEWVDNCIHIGNTSLWRPVQAERQAFVEATLKRLWDDMTGTLQSERGPTMHDIPATDGPANLARD